jgi:uncharacterized protein DUF6932
VHSSNPADVAVRLAITRRVHQAGFQPPPPSEQVEYKGEPQMIPELEEHVYLPPGVHAADLEEIATKFRQQSELRRVQMESVRWLVDLAKSAGIARMVLNGSFVTDVLEPNDVDCVLLIGPGFPRDASAEAELLAGLPFLEIALVEHGDFDLLVHTIFATDRHATLKGMVEVNL